MPGWADLPHPGTPAASDQPVCFRAQQRFSDPSEDPAGSVPPEWNAPTPPHGLPLAPLRAAARSVPAQPAPAPDTGALALPPPYLDLSTVALLGAPKRKPSSGWRKWLYVASGTLVNVGEGAREIHRRSLTAQVGRPLRGCYRIALLSLKGGVGKTTITATLGATFASIRGDRVIAVDANPDRGTLSQKVPLETPSTVRHLLRDAEGIDSYSDVRNYTSQGPSRLEVLASESDPAVSEAFSSADYARTIEVLERFYSLVLTDCGTGLMHSAMSAVLDQADLLIIISSGAVDGARSASATLDWLDAHGYQELVRNSIVVVNAVRPRSGKVGHAARWSTTSRDAAGRCRWFRSTRTWKRARRSAWTG